MASSCVEKRGYATNFGSVDRVAATRRSRLLKLSIKVSSTKYSDSVERYTGAIMKLLGRLFCLFGLHKRSGRKVVRDGPTFVSECKYCGVRMRRDHRERWSVDQGPLIDNP